MQLITVKIEKPDDTNFILGQTHFIKSVEDIYEALVGAVFPPAQHFSQVMLQVIDVIYEQPGQGDFCAAANPTGRTPAFLGHALGDVEQVDIVGPPEVDHVGPPGRLVALDADPLLLLVAGEIFSTSIRKPTICASIRSTKVLEGANDQGRGMACS